VAYHSAGAFCSAHAILVRSTIPRAPKSPNNATYFLEYMLPKDLRFEQTCFLPRAPSNFV